MTATSSRRRARRLAVLALGAVGAAIVPIGARFLVRPEAAATGFGIGTAPGDPYLAVKGIRDIGSGLMLLVVLARADQRVAGATALAAATMPLGDMIVVLARGGSPRVALGVHGATCLAMVAAAATLLSGTGRADRP
jgi:Domain of unknown function (DUF4267)